jgi:DNA-binding response OmpR family regulator
VKKEERARIRPRAPAGVPTTLIVEDNPDVAMLFSEIFAAAGHDVIVASDGDDALVQAALSRPDLVLLDGGIPGIAGADVCRHLRSHNGKRWHHLRDRTRIHDGRRGGLQRWRR